MVKVINGRVIVTDESVHQYGPSMLDRSQDIQVHGGSYSNGVLRVSFSRPVFAVEGRADHPINGCTPWQVSNTIQLSMNKTTLYQEKSFSL